MNNLTFLDEELASECDVSDATLKAVLPGGKVIHISDKINPWKFLDTCPLLYHSFEHDSYGRLQASIEASSETAVTSLVRYCYTGSYLASEPDGENIFLLPHAETYKIADDFDLPELQNMAHGNFFCQTEYAHCLPNPLIDLLDTIRFVYRHFASDKARRKNNLVETLLNYCVVVYGYHNLGENLDFLTAVNEVPAFRQDLCRTNIARNFVDDCAADIIRLPSSPVAESSKAPTTLSSRDLPSEMLVDEPHSTASDNPIPDRATRSPISISSRRRTLNAKPFRRETSDLHKHSVSPSALTAALKKHTGDVSHKVESGTSMKPALKQYKRARFDEVTSLLPARFVHPHGGLRHGKHGTEGNFSTIDAEPATAINEDSFWQGTFGNCDTKPRKAITEGTSQSARRLLFEYGRRNIRPDPELSLSQPTTKANIAVVLPHRLYQPRPVSEAEFAASSSSEDEGFTLVHRPKTTADAVSFSPMSSPELVPAESNAQPTPDDKITSDDDWNILEE